MEGALLRACDGPVQSAQVTANASSTVQPQVQASSGKEEVGEEFEAKVQAATVVKRVAFTSTKNNTGLM